MTISIPPTAATTRRDPAGPPEPTLDEIRGGYRESVCPDRADRADLFDWPALAAAAATGSALRRTAVFASAGRVCGRAPITAIPGWTCDDAARVLLLDAIARAAAGGPIPGDAELAGLIRTLYERGDTHERRAVLRALPYLPPGAATPDLTRTLTEDALRGDDRSLVAAAMGPCGRAVLTDAQWRRGVLKCLDLGLPLRPTVSGLGARSDTELVHMLADFARERADSAD
ncbi:EboA domain-containing protein [Yinghuangia sp. ASG 101]|uniref:EboA domain-containing protein n=1 Tax=Yinghuangia sp. ASG 101 TaxID=2896848 RepID=UPI001E50C7D4|nr:EboA domain-containing protein [Yinghuangia sp. ASG 101]UGQ13333.1 EboA domain-containing protein [Yinghuangia sp. ASG 101]